MENGYLKFIHPKKDRLYITVEEKAGQIGSIILTDNVRMRSQIAIVRAIGEEVKEFKVGDKVLISFGAGIHIQLPETYSVEPFHRIITEMEILSLIGDEYGKN